MPALFFKSFFVRTLLRLAFIGLLLLWLVSSARATHIVGGEMELSHRSGSTYALTLNLYFDAINGNAGALDQRMTAGIFDKATNVRMQNVTLPLVSNTFVQYTNPACTQSGLSTRKLVYTADVTLSAGQYANAAGYYAAVERCCRNMGISNILNPDAAAQTFYLEFPAVVRGGRAFPDSTPKIFPPLGDYACRGQLFYYDFGGQDPDGDSLAYDMVTPLNGHATSAQSSPTPAAAPYAPVTWTTGLSAQNQMPGTQPLSIDARTGRLTVRPSQLGLFVFGVRCAEYRQGVKIGETRRDFQLYVLNCPTNAAPTLQLLAGPTRPAYRPGLDTLHLLPGQDHCLRLRFTDPDPSSQLTVSVRPVNFSAPVPVLSGITSGTVHATGQPDTLQATLCFSDCQDTKGKVFLLDVMVADNGCSLPRRDTVRLAFTAASAPNTPPVLTTSFPADSVPTAPVLIRLPLGSTYSATLLGTDADPNPLVLSAAGQGFDLAAAGMEFAARNGSGRATATFRWQATCAAAGPQPELMVVFQLRESAVCEPAPQSRTVRFQVVPATAEIQFLPANVITPNNDGLNDTFALPDLPPDFCGARFAGIRIFSRWGNEVYQSPERSFRWAGPGMAGTYFYLVTYTDGRRYKGWLEVAP